MRRALPVFAGFFALGALLLALFRPHHHDGTEASHPAHSCVACKVQSEIPTPAPVQPSVILPKAGGWIECLTIGEAPTEPVVYAAALPRAPPSFC